MTSRTHNRRWIRALAALILGAALAGIGYEARGRDLEGLTARIAELEAAQRSQRDNATREIAPTPVPFLPEAHVSAAAPVQRELDTSSTQLGARIPDQSTREQGEAKRRRYLNELERIITDGAPSDWQPEPEIVSAVSSIARIATLRCAEDLCRIEVSHVNDKEEPLLAEKLASLPPFSAGTLYDPDPANKRTVLYVARPDVGFPEL